MDRAVSIKQKIDNIRNILRTHQQLNFNQLFSDTASRTEVIVSFLAILELIKDESVRIKQGGSFEELLITKV